MPLTSLSVIESAIRAAWSADTCDPVDLPDWTPDDPSRDQCGVTALTVHDLLGGQLLLADVLRTDGSRQGMHWWNRLAGGIEVDLTRAQFTADEHVQRPTEVDRPPGEPTRLREQYRLLTSRVHTALGSTPDRSAHHSGWRCRSTRSTRSVTGPGGTSTNSKPHSRYASS
jgi:hypothetical protein